ncbi:hypothetical protein [Actinomadura livida]|uniref:Uncharacterized protein n=1 Tax=Actinomadura livida TaxID=79909 RepID=A0A7W7MZZ4_9ACTN|nr:MULTISPECIES: hypothetical protein [Actinomadura]MBB4776422.1 hypothetical protein [Actinomadura catellatispora]
MNRPRRDRATTMTISFGTLSFETTSSDQRLRDARALHAPGRKAVTA